MKRTTSIASVFGALCFSLALSSHALTLEIDAQDHSYNAGSGAGLDTGLVLNVGDLISVTVDTNDTWSAGAGAIRTGNADGLGGFSNYTTPDGSFKFGSLVGEINGVFFLIGTSFNGVAQAAGTLKLFYWDSNFADNSGSVFANVEVTPVPLPAAAWLFVSALVGLIALRRRKDPAKAELATA